MSTMLNVIVTDWRLTHSLSKVDGDEDVMIKAIHYLEENTALLWKACCIPTIFRVDDGQRLEHPQSLSYLGNVMYKFGRLSQGDSLRIGNDTHALLFFRGAYNIEQTSLACVYSVCTLDNRVWAGMGPASKDSS